ncbi:hypothetical protein EAE96_008604 [Botrytis aclada]|nr:hypothetical protein EAE96_008604 [Botrytis aclada]
MVDSTKFAHYHLTRGKIDDDSLSYIDHDYWEGLINQILESQWVRKASARGRDRIFRIAFEVANKPSYDDDPKPKSYRHFSEARRFKEIITAIWNASAGRDRGRKLYREGERIPRDSADKTPRGKDFGNTVCSMPRHTRGFFSFVVETLNAAKEYASDRSQILALRESLAIDPEERQLTETSSFAPKESPSNQKELGLDQVVLISSNRAGYSKEESSFEANNPPSRPENLITGDATSFLSNIAAHSIKAELDMGQLISNSSNRLEYSTVEQSNGNSSSSSSNAFDPLEHPIGLGDVVEPLDISSNELEHLAVKQPDFDRSASMSIASDSSENSDDDRPRSMPIKPSPLEYSIQSEEITEPIAITPIRLGRSNQPHHPPLVGIDITGHGSLHIKKAFLDDRSKSYSALQVHLNVLCTQSKDYIVCGAGFWEKGGHVECQFALDIVGVWLEKIMRQYSCQSLISFIHELGARQQLNLGQLHRAISGFSLLSSRSKFDLVPGDAVILNRSQNVSQNSSSHRHLFQITNQNVAGKFIGRGGVRARQVESILGLRLSIKRSNGKEYFVCKPCAHQNLDRQEKVNRERCRIVLEIISIWLWEHWNAKDDYIDLPEFLLCLKGSNDKMMLEEIYEAAAHSMRRTRLPYSHKAFFESNYTIEAESGD